MFPPLRKGGKGGVTWQSPRIQLRAIARPFPSALRTANSCTLSSIVHPPPCRYPSCPRDVEGTARAGDHAAHRLPGNARGEDQLWQRGCKKSNQGPGRRPICAQPADWGIRPQERTSDGATSTGFALSTCKSSRSPSKRPLTAPTAVPPCRNGAMSTTDCRTTKSPTWRKRSFTVALWSQGTRPTSLGFRA